MADSVQLPLPLGDATGEPAELIDCSAPDGAALDRICAALANLAVDWWRRQAQKKVDRDANTPMGQVTASPGEELDQAAAQRDIYPARPA